MYPTLRPSSVPTPAPSHASDLTTIAGWVAVSIAIVCFGSFAVPIKFPAVRNAEPPIHPFAFQTYKSFWVFSTSWLVLAVPNPNPFVFTFWGIVGAALWVPAGAAYVLAVDHVGIGITQAIVSSLTIVIASLWGTLFFGERIARPTLAAVAFALLASGVGSMAYYSRPADEPSDQEPSGQEASPQGSYQGGALPSGLEGGLDARRDAPLETSAAASPLLEPPPEGRLSGAEPAGSAGDGRGSERPRERSRPRWFGLAAACFNGFLGGSAMVPLEFFNRGGGVLSGIDYVVSFGVGVGIVTVAAWAGLHLRHALGGEAPPSLRFETLAVPGSIAGVTWSVGNFASALATLCLGEAVGYSSTQAAVLVAGLWGFFYFGEAPRGRAAWLLGAVACTAGLVLLGWLTESSSA